MFLENEQAAAFARDHALRGIVLAYAANEAFDGLVAAEEAHSALNFRPDDLSFGKWLEAGAVTRTRVARNRLNFDGLAASAGALLRAYSMGGEYLAVQNGLPMYRQDDGSYTPSSIHQIYRLP